MTFQVAIIGAGLGGPALALSLVHVPGITCTIYELRPDSYEQGQHISLAPNAMRVLQHLGVHETLDALGNTYEGLHLRNARGVHLATFHNGHRGDYGFGAMRIHRRLVQQVLIDECKAKGIRIRHGMKVTEMREPDGGKAGVEVTFANGETELADLVVGADGLHSAVRRYVVPDSRSVYAHMLGVTGYLQRNRLHPSVAQVALPSHFIGHNGFIAIMPSDASGEEVGFFSTMDFPEDKPREEWDALFDRKDDIREILTSLFGAEQGWCEVVESMCKAAEADSLCTWPFYVAPKLPRWSSPSGKVLVLGDAAHAMIPTGGLGASLALEDAECLSLVLKHVASAQFNTRALPTLMQVWEGHRKERLTLIQAFTDKNRRLRAPGGNWQFLKEWAMWLFFKIMGSGGQAEEIYVYDTKTFEELLTENNAVAD